MTKTIKELYDAGQRQFPMRGGGVSPRVLFTPNGQTIICEPQGHLIHETWSGDGYYYRDKTESCFDLLPIHLPDYQAKYEALVKQVEQINKTLTEFEKFIAGKAIKLPFGKRMIVDLLAYQALKRNLAAAIRGE